jgi:NAD-dependent deacetylase
MIDPVDKAISTLEECNSVLAVTGSGISAESGLSTYRGTGGLYEDKTCEEGISIEEALSCDTFRSKPELTWKYLHQMESGARGKTWNRAHKILVEMESRFTRMWTLTQNVDELHQRAGAKNILEIHGNLYRLFCIACGARIDVPDYSSIEEHPPRCGACGDGILRPDVVLFGEALAADAQQRFYEEIARGFGAVMVIGTSALFPYIQMPVHMGRRAGWTTIEINPDETCLSSLVDIRLAMKASEGLEAIWQGLA